MIAFDTNILLRLLVADDRRQAKQAQALIERAVAAKDEVLLPNIVLCEVAWVLKSVFSQSRSEVSQVLRLLLETDPFVFENRTAVCQALDQFERGPGDFSDYLIGTVATAFAAATTYTFDSALRRNPAFAVPHSA